jgi:2-iminobutanoate/2-iminopropanoate deaminase
MLSSDGVFIRGDVGYLVTTQTSSRLISLCFLQERALQNISAVLEAGGSSLNNVVKANVFITTMKDFDAMNVGYLKFFSDPLPVSFRAGCTFCS